MHWVCDASDEEASEATLGFLLEHLRRRSMSSSRLNATANIVRAALGNAGGPGDLWLGLDWEHDQPRLSVGFARAGTYPRYPTSQLADGVWAGDEWSSQMGAHAIGPAIEVDLPASRPPEADIDLMPDQESTEPQGFLGSVAATMAGRVEMGATLAEAAEVAGATAARSARSAYVAAHGGKAPGTPAEVAQAFIDYHNSAGSGFFLVQADDQRAVLSNRSCPFGAAVTGRPIMCRTTSALLGSMAAQAHGGAAVVLDEAIALGDSRCRMVLDLDAAPSRWSHTYRWPPAGPGAQGLAPVTRGLSMTRALPITRGLRVALSLRLPRDRLSVALIRHMTAHALREVGTCDEDVFDVEVALTEAATNVVKHSGPGDAYDVEVTIGPSLIELRVIDVGRGFDSEAISQFKAQPHDEQGRGVALMNALVDQARFASVPERGTIVHLLKALHFDDDSPARKLMLRNLSEADKDRGKPGR